MHKFKDENEYVNMGQDMFSSDTWETYLQRAERTIGTFSQMSILCEDVLESVQSMTKKLGENIKTMWGPKELPPYQQFVSAYFIRNITYLRSSYLLASGALCGPSRDLQRTIYETILRGYLFIVDEKEADLMYCYIERKISRTELDKLRKRKFWPFGFLTKQLYERETTKKHKKLYTQLSYFSHASILGAFKDLEYPETEVKDCLNVILSLAYGNIQMMSEGLFSFLDQSLKKFVKETLFKIADSQHEITIFEPDQKRWSSKIKLKNGNFMKALK